MKNYSIHEILPIDKFMESYGSIAINKLTWVGDAYTGDEEGNFYIASEEMILENTLYWINPREKIIIKTNNSVYILNSQLDESVDIFADDKEFHRLVENSDMKTAIEIMQL